MAGVHRRQLEGIAAQRRIGLGLTALQRTEAPQVGHERSNRVAGHDVGFKVGVAPARQPAALLVDRQQGATDVAGDVRAGQRQPLVLRAVGVPQREVLVVGPAIGAMDLVVVAAVAAIGVAAGQRLQQRVVQRGIENGAVIGMLAVHAHGVQLLAPLLLGQAAHAFEAKQLAVLHAVLAQVGTRAFRVYVRDGAYGGHRAALGGVETQPGPARLLLAFHAMARAGQTTGLAPGAEGLERAVELDPEPGGVLVAAAEALGDQLAFHHAVADHVDDAADDRMALVGLAHVDQHMAFGPVSREGVALGGGAGARGGLGVNAAVAGQPHLVIAGLTHFTLMGVAGRVGLVIEALGIVGIEVAARPDAAGHRQDRDLAALLPAPGPGQERMAEAADLRVVIAPAGVVLADRADLDQAEGGRGTREGVAVVLAADEGVDLTLQRGRCGLQHRGEPQHGQTGQSKQRAAQGRKFAKGRQSAHAVGSCGSMGVQIPVSGNLDRFKWRSKPRRFGSMHSAPQHEQPAACSLIAEQHALLCQPCLKFAGRWFRSIQL